MHTAESQEAEMRTSFFSNQNKLKTTRENDDENFSINENVVDLFIVIPQQWS